MCAKGFFTDEEYKVLRGVLPDHVKIPLILAYWTGMRAGELLGLQWDQLDLGRGLIRIEPGTTKNNQGRLIPLVKEVIKALWQWKQETLLHYPPLCLGVSLSQKAASTDSEKAMGKSL